MQVKGWGRRGLSMVAVVLLLGSALVACGSSEDSSGSGTGGGASTTTSTTFPKLLEDVPQPIITIAYLLHDELTDQGYDIGEIDDGFVGRVEKAVEEFQRDHDLPQTGALDQATAMAFQNAAGTDALTIVRSVQSVLTELGDYTGTIDGQYGPDTVAAVEKVQDKAGITKLRGQVDGATIAAMVQQWRDQKLPNPDLPDTSGTNLVKLGDSGKDVERLQKRLAELGYRPGDPDGQFGTETLSAVTAFQKHEGLPRDGVVGPDVRKHLQDPTGAGPKSSAPAPHIEVDLDRQIAFVVLAGGVTILDVSTGSGKTYTSPGSNVQQVAYTPTGTFDVYRAVNAPVVAPLGTLYKPLYFKEGWAMHGEPLVPPYPASHGCVRTHDWDQDWLFPQIPVGTQIVIYGQNPGGVNQPANAGAGY
jgi:peptidoglycan hydrolase-like protein with peptidoglycan-binding domain